MSNYCSNKLIVTSPFGLLIGQIEAFRNDAYSYECRTALSLNNLYPCPDEEKYGYDWRLINWGINWEITATLIIANSGCLEYHFVSAESPPIAAFSHIAKKYPQLHFKLEYNNLYKGLAGTANINALRQTIKTDVIESTICPKCKQHTKRIRGDCYLCGNNIQKLIVPLGSILERSDIKRLVPPEEKKRKS